MEYPMYENKAYVTDGFTHGCYWKSSGKFEFYADNNLIHQNFGTKMNHHHYSTTTSSAGGGGANNNRANNTNTTNTNNYNNTSGVPYSDSGGRFYPSGTNRSRSVDRNPDSDYYGREQSQPVRGSSAMSGSDGAMRTSRKLPAVAKNGKRQLPPVQGGRSNSSLDGPDYRMATQSPTGRRLPVPQRSMRGGVGGGGAGGGAGVQPPLIDNFNIDLSVKVGCGSCQS